MKKKRIITILILLSSLLLLTQCVKKVYDTTGTINGIVTDSATGEPVANVSITLSPSGKTINTGSDGVYEIPGLEPQQYKIQAMHPEYKTNTKTVTVVAGETVRGDMTLTKK